LKILLRVKESQIEQLRMKFINLICHFQDNISDVDALVFLYNEKLGNTHLVNILLDDKADYISILN
jgi:hypothetical protein